MNKKLVAILILSAISLYAGDSRDITALTQDVRKKTQQWQEELNKTQGQETKPQKTNQENLLDYKQVEVGDNIQEQEQAEQAEQVENTQSSEKQEARGESRKKGVKKVDNQVKGKFVYTIPRGAKQVEMGAEIEVKMVAKKVAVITFPFLITDVEMGEFARRTQGKFVEKYADEIDNIDIKVVDNKITIKSETMGDIDLLVRGGAYPILLHFMINHNDGKNYYAIIDTYEEERKKKPKQIVAENHIEMLVGITKALYENQKVAGFKEDDRKYVFDMKEYGLQMMRTKAMLGQGYLGEVWEVINKHDKTIKLTEEIFFSDGVYFISLVSDIVEPKKSTKMFVIRKPQ